MRQTGLYHEYNVPEFLTWPTYARTIPDPTSLALLALGSVALLARRRAA